MGGRKTVTYVVDTKAGAAGFAASQRCLGEKLAGVIFGCTTDTFKECIKDRVFGLPRSHMLYVRDIEPGLPLFLFNYSGRTLHGVFRSTSDGALNIKPHGWTGGTTAPTQFPAQVRVEVYRQCAPILETKFRSIIKSNYVSDDRHFVFELDTVQVRELCKLFKCEVPKNSNAQNLLRQIQPVHVKPRIPLQTSDTSSKSAWPAKKSPGCPSRGASTAQEDKRNKQGRGVLNLDDFPALGGPQASIKKGVNTTKKTVQEKSKSNRDSQGRATEADVETTGAAIKQQNECGTDPRIDKADTVQERGDAVRIVRALTGGGKSVPAKELHLSENGRDGLSKVNSSCGREKEKPIGATELASSAQETEFGNQKSQLHGWSALQPSLEAICSPHAPYMWSPEQGISIAEVNNATALQSQGKDDIQKRAKPLEVAETSLPLESVFLRARISATQSVDSTKSVPDVAEDSQSSTIMLENVCEWTRSHQAVENSRSEHKTQANWHIPGHPFCNRLKIDEQVQKRQVSSLPMCTEKNTKIATKKEVESEDSMEVDEQTTAEEIILNQHSQNLTVGSSGLVSNSPKKQKSCKEEEETSTLKTMALPVVGDRIHISESTQVEASIMDDDPFMQECIGVLKTDIEAFPSELQCSGDTGSCSGHNVQFSQRTDVTNSASCSLASFGATIDSPNRMLDMSWTYPAYEPARNCGEHQYNPHLNPANQIVLNSDVNSSTASGLSRLPMFNHECTATSSGQLSSYPLYSEVEDHLLIVGGLNKSIVSSVEIYDFKSSSWASISELPFQKFLCGDAAAIGAWLYVLIGEVDGKVSSSPSFCLNTITGMWHRVAPCVTPRANMGMAAINGNIVAIGGRNESQNSLSSVEYYDPSTDRWFNGVEMRTPRYDAGVCVKEGVIYVCGGFDGSNFLRSVEALDPRVGYWQTLPDMSSVRGGVASAFCYGSLWAAGGDDGSGALDTVEAYDPRAATWTEAPSLCSPRAYCTIEIVNERLYVIGGRKSELSLGCLGMERFDPVKCCWMDGLSAGSTGASVFLEHMLLLWFRYSRLGELCSIHLQMLQTRCM